MAWIIEHESNKDENERALVWSNKEGWIDSDDYDTFDDKERETLSLPIEGVWVRVPWNKN